jgi:hypothetical protein
VAAHGPRMAIYRIETIAGLRQSQIRTVVLLSAEGDDDVDAAPTFSGLNEKRDRELRTRFDAWIDGVINDQWFHGFNRPEDRGCFVFKWKEKRLRHRLYGFLWHPCRNTNARLEICVLATHATKTTEETDPAQLAKARALRADYRVRMAISMIFPDDPPGKTRCIN